MQFSLHTARHTAHHLQPTADLCALELGQKTYKTIKIKHYYQCIAWEQVEPIPNQH